MSNHSQFEAQTQKMNMDIHHKALNAFNQGDIKAAHLSCVEILKPSPNFHQSYHLLALINIQIHQYAKASELLKRAIKISDSAKYRIELAKTYSLLGISDGVISIANTIDIKQLNSFYELDTLGVILSRVEQHQTALQCFEKAIALKPTPEILYNYAVSAKFCGQHDAAQTALNKALRLKPDYHQAHFALADLTEDKAIDAHIKQLNKMLAATPDTPVEVTLHLSHALAKEYEKQKNYGLAFETLLKAKSQKSKLLPYNRQDDKRLFDGLYNSIKNLNKQPVSNTGSDSQRPIFVVGMPRSGTTLVERILSSHSQVTSGGELEDFSLLLKHASQSTGNSVLNHDLYHDSSKVDFTKIADAYLARTAHIGNNQGKFVDKLPFNFFYLPFIRRAFPEAKIICLLRNPLDTCVGNFRQLFSINNPYYNYTQSLEDCAWFYQQFKTWIQTWIEFDEQGTKLLEYELLTKNPEHYVPELINFCGLDWQSQCLQIESNTAPVSTASKMQVRQPINQKSIGSWKRYQPYTTDIEAFFDQQTTLRQMTYTLR
ncbi:sulfotransferase [Paraglaciecola sp.]|uniref:tetratricopeptide repeat-containing sulfotransferase family protein n=1 Tax=Paraglaciecola sp. TaxID=1920173 RepID=UPI003298FC2C